MILFDEGTAYGFAVVDPQPLGVALLEIRVNAKLRLDLPPPQWPSRTDDPTKDFLRRFSPGLRRTFKNPNSNSPISTY
jgi:hypothetical protein